MQKKTCIHCNETKGIDQFHKNLGGKYGVHSVCKPCKNKRDLARHVSDLPRLALRQRTYMANNPHARITASLRKRMRQVLKGNVKCAKTFELLGCSAEEWKVHLEKQFKDGMSCDNYGDWEIDHIRPCASFNLELEEDQRACFHYSNTQPLWQSENASKGCKF